MTETKFGPTHIKRLRKWAAALESGEYKQARDALRKKTGNKYSYCVLGVACEISKKMNENEMSYGYYQPTSEVNQFFLDGIGYHLNSILRLLDSPFSLIGMNDNQKITFDEFALMIYFFCDVVESEGVESLLHPIVPETPAETAS